MTSQNILIIEIWIIMLLLAPNLLGWFLNATPPRIPFISKWWDNLTLDKNFCSKCGAINGGVCGLILNPDAKPEFQICEYCFKHQQLETIEKIWQTQEFKELNDETRK